MSKVYQEALKASQETDSIICLYLLNGKYKYCKEAAFPALFGKYRSQGKRVELYCKLHHGTEI
ncbi:MAG: hypothetical protein H6Q67_1866 [Firmicutes bacterium]|nr:hypothetical protein [Bacillota bacterium]